MEEHIHANEARFYRGSDDLRAWKAQAIVKELMTYNAKAAGLWIPFLR